MKRTLALIASALSVALLASACGGGAAAKGIDPEACAPTDPLNRRTVNVPPTLGGLRVQKDDAATKKIVDRIKKDTTYLCDATVFALRAGEELKAVFTIERMNAEARVEDIEFRRKIVSDISGTTSSAPARIGSALVYKAKVNEQVLSVWFHERFLYILTVREDASFSAAADTDRLLAEAVTLEPVAA